MGEYFRGYVPHLGTDGNNPGPEKQTLEGYRTMIDPLLQGTLDDGSTDEGVTSILIWPSESKRMPGESAAEAHLRIQAKREGGEML